MEILKTTTFYRSPAFVLALVMICAVFSCLGHASAANEEQRWNEATLAYQIKNYSKAEQILEELMNEGMANPELFYNLGNTYHQQGKKGMAVWMYEKTLKLQPRHGDARRNLRIALPGAPQESNGNGISFLLLPISWIYGRISTNEWILLLDLVFLAASGFLLFWLLARNPTIRRNALWGSIGSIALVFLVAAFTIPHIIQSEFHKYASVTGKGAIVRSAPGLDEPEYFEAREGERFEIQEANIKGWMRIKRPSDGRVGYLPESLIREI